jgi:cytochrome oxidase Cu insertion factor (SCO1/SenC/PrrC family)
LEDFMRAAKPFLPVLAVLMLLIASGPTSASQGVQLTDSVKAAIAAAKPVRGDAVTREMFNGKPVLVVFFASW